MGTLRLSSALFGLEAERGPEVRPTVKNCLAVDCFLGQSTGVVEVMDGLLVFEK